MGSFPFFEAMTHPGLADRVPPWSEVVTEPGLLTVTGEGVASKMQPPYMTMQLTLLVL